MEKNNPKAAGSSRKCYGGTESGRGLVEELLRACQTVSLQSYLRAMTYIGVVLSSLQAALTCSNLGILKSLPSPLGTADLQSTEMLSWPTL